LWVIEHTQTFELIVRPAAQREIVDIGRTAIGERQDVMEFEPAGLCASTARTDERAPARVSRPDGAAN